MPVAKNVWKNHKYYTLKMPYPPFVSSRGFFEAKINTVIYRCCCCSHCFNYQHFEEPERCPICKQMSLVPESESLYYPISKGLLLKYTGAEWSISFNMEKLPF